MVNKALGKLTQHEVVVIRSKLETAKRSLTFALKLTDHKVSNNEIEYSLEKIEYCLNKLK